MPRLLDAEMETPEDKPMRRRQNRQPPAGSHSSWAKELYDLYLPVRAALARRTEAEINAAIDEAVTEVRRVEREKGPQTG